MGKCLGFWQETTIVPVHIVCMLVVVQASWEVSVLMDVKPLKKVCVYRDRSSCTTFIILLFVKRFPKTYCKPLERVFMAEDISSCTVLCPLVVRENLPKRGA